MGTKNIEFENIPQNCVSTYARLRYTAVVMYVFEGELKLAKF